MGFIKAFSGALGGAMADQWKDFITPQDDAPATAALFKAQKKGTDSGRGSNTRGSENIITNGSKILVPDNTAVITLQDGAVTGIITEPGGFIYTNDSQNSQSFFSGGGLLSSTLKTSFERFKFGGTPGEEQTIIYVNLKEIPANRFGTQSEIYWDDAFLGTQVGALARGTYTMKIIDPILFVKNFVPVDYLRPNGDAFDFADMDNPAGEQLFNEVVGSLAAAFSNYTNDPSKGNRMTKIQGDQIGFAQSLSQAVEDDYQWKSSRGLEIVKVAITAIEYDDDTKEMLKDVKRADSLSGSRGNSFMQQSVARGFQAAGQNGGGAGMAFMGMGVNATGGAMGAFQQQPGAQPYQQPFGQNYQQYPQNPQYQQNGGQYSQENQQYPQDGAQYQQGNPQYQQNNNPQQTQAQEDPYEKLAKMKKLADAGVISQEEFESAKNKLLGV